MWRRRRLAYLVVGIAVLAVGVFLMVAWLRDTPESEIQAPASALAPDFTLLNKGGLPVTLSETAGTIRVLHFWASWSPYSRTELKLMQALEQEFGSDVRILAIGRDTMQQDGERLLRELGLESAPWALFDPADTYYLDIGGFNMPETVVLDKQGTIVFHAHGPVDGDALRTVIKNTLASTHAP